MRRKIFLPLLSLGLLSFAIMHVVKANQTPPKPDPPIEPSRNPFIGSIAGSGVVEPKSENISIGSHLPGIVSKVYVRVGQRVKEGEPLFEIDERQLRAELAVRKANLLATQASLKKLAMEPRQEEIPPLEAKVREMKANVADVKDQLHRAQKLVGTRAIGEEDAIHRTFMLAVAEAQLVKAEADLKLLLAGAWIYDKKISESSVDQAEAAVKQTETELKRIAVTAPIDGTILQKNIREGEYVGIPPSQALLVLGDISTLHVRVDIDENDLPRFQSDLIGVAHLRGDPKSKIPLKYVRTEPYVIPKRALTGAGTERVDTRVLQVIYAVEKTDIPLYVGQQLDVYLDAKENSLAESSKR